MARSTRGRKPLLIHSPNGSGCEPDHERATHREVARWLADIAGLSFGGDLNHATDTCGYLLPVDTIVGKDKAASFGVTCEADFFGGVVPHAFVATKTITHPLVAPDAAAPQGWSDAFPKSVQDVVLAGYSAFSRRDAKTAGEILLRQGPVRIKPAFAKGGIGQVLVQEPQDLRAALDSGGIDFPSGVTLEENLTEVETYSVGQVRVAGLTASYFGTQRLTPNNEDAMVYGGSDLLVARGEYDALLDLVPDDCARTAVEQARVYDAAATECFSGFLSSRRNYDIARGRDAAGELRSGVLEQSWRVGGASPAEVLALAAFRDDPELKAAHASSVEVYGVAAEVPGNAVIFCRDNDPQAGHILKYAVVERA